MGWTPIKGTSTVEMATVRKGPPRWRFRWLLGWRGERLSGQCERPRALGLTHAEDSRSSTRNRTCIMRGKPLFFREAKGSRPLPRWSPASRRRGEGFALPLFRFFLFPSPERKGRLLRDRWFLARIVADSIACSKSRSRRMFLSRARWAAFRFDFSNPHFLFSLVLRYTFTNYWGFFLVHKSISFNHACYSSWK